MAVDWVTIIDFAICAFILLFLIGERFDQWPGVTQALFSGKPSDYIDPFRYYAFYCVYISTYVAVGVAIYNLGLFAPADEEMPDLINQITAKLGSKSWTISALYLLALSNEKHVQKWDALWRNRLQLWARIPKAVEEVRDCLLLNEDILTPSPQRLDAVRSQMRKLGVETYWEPIIDHWQAEREKSSLDWHYLKAIYTLRICKELQGAAITPADISRHENRLHDLARVLPKLDRENEEVRDYVKEVSALFAYFVEGLCKHLVRKNPSKNAQRDCLRNLDFHPRFSDTQEVQILGVTLKCLFGIWIASFMAMFAYMWAMDWAGIAFRDEGWLTLDKLAKWGFGSALSYSMAVFIAVIIEKIATAQETEPGAITYIATLFFSALGSLTYFQVVSSPANWDSHVLLALSMGVIAIAVIRSLTKPTCRNKQEVRISALYHAVLLGLLSAPLQTLVFVSYGRPEGYTIDAALVITAVYGFAKGFIVTFVVSFMIQDSLRRQLAVAHRSSPRVRFKTSLPALLQGESFNVTTRNISRGGLLIEPGRPVTPGQEIILNFDFGAVEAKVRWLSGKFAGLAFNKDDPNLDNLRLFIHERFGVSYA